MKFIRIFFLLVVFLMMTLGVDLVLTAMITFGLQGFDDEVISLLCTLSGMIWGAIVICHFRPLFKKAFK